MPVITAKIVEEVKKLIAIKRDQKASFTIYSKLINYVNEIDRKIKLQNKEVHFETHQIGLTGFINDEKAFCYINLYSDSFSVNYWTGKKVISGLIKGMFSKGEENTGSKWENIHENVGHQEFERQINYACTAYNIATEEWYSSHKFNMPSK